MATDLQLTPVPGQEEPYDPWAALAERSDVTLTWHDDGYSGLTTFSSRTISLRRGMPEAQQRCVLAHEMVHLERGPAWKPLTDLEEAVVENIAARRLLPMRRLVEAFLAVEGGLDHGARLREHLQVDSQTLTARLSSLTNAERFELTFAVIGAEGTADLAARGVL